MHVWVDRVLGFVRFVINLAGTKKSMEGALTMAEIHIDCAASLSGNGKNKVQPASHAKGPMTSATIDLHHHIQVRFIVLPFDSPMPRYTEEA